jgi:hypothetical protein
LPQPPAIKCPRQCYTICVPTCPNYCCPAAPPPPPPPAACPAICATDCIASCPQPCCKRRRNLIPKYIAEKPIIVIERKRL